MAALEIVDGVDVSQLSPYRPARFGPGGAGADGKSGVTGGGGGGGEREEEKGGGGERGGDGAKRSKSAGGWGLGGGRDGGDGGGGEGGGKEGVGGGWGGVGGAKCPHDFGESGERGGELDLGKVADPASLQAKKIHTIRHHGYDTTERVVYSLGQESVY
jgi:hypothetical protein